MSREIFQRSQHFFPNCRGKCSSFLIDLFSSPLFYCCSRINLRLLAWKVLLDFFCWHFLLAWENSSYIFCPTHTALTHFCVIHKHFCSITRCCRIKDELRVYMFKHTSRYKGPSHKVTTRLMQVSQREYLISLKIAGLSIFEMLL